jgi:hypothetical protein
LAAACAAAILAVSPVWWSQAIIAEVYSLHGLFIAAVLWLALRWGDRVGEAPASEAAPAAAASRLLTACACALGLSLTHHRLSLLLGPALAVFVLWSEPELLRRPRRWPPLLAALLLPLLLYAYIPLRGLVTTSLDGRYENTWQGFWRWVMASQYSAFLTADPFDLQRGPSFYFELFQSQFGWTGLVVGVLGLIALLRKPRRWLLIVLAFTVNLVFALSYRAADVEVFFTPVFLLWSLLVAAGLSGLIDAVSALTRRRSQTAGRTSPEALRVAAGLFAALLTAGCLLEPLLLASANLPSLDRRNDWALHDYGLDVLQQPLPNGATIVGLLGEMTLLRYFQRTEALRPDLQTIAADGEEERHAAIAAGLAQGMAVYITRPLAGAPERYSLAAVGPLVRVWPKGQAELLEAEHYLGRSLGQAVLLSSHEQQIVGSHSGPAIRLTLRWQVAGPVKDDLKVSARLLDGSGAVVSAADSVPVHNTYPSWAWQVGETVGDLYDLPIPPDRGSGPHRLLIILYRAADGSEVGRADLGVIGLP